MYKKGVDNVYSFVKEKTNKKIINQLGNVSTLLLGLMKKIITHTNGVYVEDKLRLCCFFFLLNCIPETILAYGTNCWCELLLYFVNNLLRPFKYIFCK